MGPKRPTQDELLRQLLNPDDDRAWKLAVGHILTDVAAEQLRMEERVRASEASYWKILGGFVLVASILPFVAVFLGTQV